MVPDAHVEGKMNPPTMSTADMAMIADPSYLGSSLRAYYDHVDRIVLSYDATSTSWTGTPPRAAPLPWSVTSLSALLPGLGRSGRCETSMTGVLTLWRRSLYGHPTKRNLIP